MRGGGDQMTGAGFIANIFTNNADEKGFEVKHVSKICRI
jgi:hypothetical protein